jgi:predicted membrane-bound mannosyltransferase
MYRLIALSWLPAFTIVAILWPLVIPTGCATTGEVCIGGVCMTPDKQILACRNIIVGAVVSVSALEAAGAISEASAVEFFKAAFAATQLLDEWEDAVLNGESSQELFHRFSQKLAEMLELQPTGLDITPTTLPTTLPGVPA